MPGHEESYPAGVRPEQLAPWSRKCLPSLPNAGECTKGGKAVARNEVYREFFKDTSLPLTLQFHLGKNPATTRPALTILYK